ncbi:LOW QUALITY PROTEIN: dnaJ homolog subfamily B member 7 [Ctenodactylus gundi]
MVDYHKVLGLQRHTSPEDIKKAYHGMALKWHPDKNPEDEEAEKKFKEVAEANEVLSNGEKDIYDKYGTKGYGGDGSDFDDECVDFIFSNAGDIFKETGERDPFSSHFFEDHLDLSNSPTNSYRTRRSTSRGAGPFFSASSEHPVFETFSSFDTGHTPYGSMWHKSLATFAFLAFSDCGMCNCVAFTTSGKIINGRNINTIIENNQEKEEAKDDLWLKSFLVNGVGEEGFAEECRWRRQSFDNPSPTRHPGHRSHYTSVDNDKHGIAGVTSSWGLSNFSAGFKESCKKKNKHKQVYKKKSTKRNC